MFTNQRTGTAPDLPSDGIKNLGFGLELFSMESRSS